jgi:hypothetical protein
MRAAPLGRSKDPLCAFPLAGPCSPCLPPSPSRAPRFPAWPPRRVPPTAPRPCAPSTPRAPAAACRPSGSTRCLTALLGATRATWSCTATSPTSRAVGPASAPASRQPDGCSAATAGTSARPSPGAGAPAPRRRRSSRRGCAAPHTGGSPSARATGASASGSCAGRRWRAPAGMTYTADFGSRTYPPPTLSPGARPSPSLMMIVAPFGAERIAWMRASAGLC